MKRVIGLMSGTSLDGVDAALLETDGRMIARFGAGAMRAYRPEEAEILNAAVQAALAWGFDGPEPDFAAAERVLTETHGDAIAQLLKAEGLSADDIDLVGFHGQTVLHRAPLAGELGQTRQIGDAHALAGAIGINVIHDFRSADMRAGGQGAPLATLYHQALAQHSKLDLPIAVLNLGGVANVTWLAPGEDPVAFDTGPANGLIDAWCQARIGKPYDRNGELAAAGRMDAAALDALMDHPFFNQPPPKSLDRWDFTLDPVQHLTDADGAATLTGFTARTIASAFHHLGHPGRVLVTGGGRHNPVLMTMLAASLGVTPEPVEAVGWRGDLLEAEAFAWLAARVDAGLPTSLPSTTGVSAAVCGGVLVRG
jgi:anhydro-N-acetylmuramic acid kinase